MSTADKEIFFTELSDNLSDTLTANQLKSTMKIVSDTSTNYEITYVPSELALNGNTDLLETFLTAKKIEGRSEKSLYQYRYHIKRMLDSVKIPVESINANHIRRYLMDEQNRGVSDKTLENIRSVFSSFFSWLNNEELISKNPVRNITTIKCAKKVRLPFSEVNMEMLKECCDDSCNSGERCTGIRNKALISFLYSTGCRISEVCELNRDDVDLKEMECIVHGKGNKERTVYLTAVTTMLLQRYLSERTDDSSALFVGRGSERLTAGGVRYMMKQLEKKSGIENVHPHRFRRTLATNLINHGMPIQDVATILGHEKLDTTMKYVHVTKTKVKNSYMMYM